MVTLMLKNPPTNIRDIRDVGSIPGQEDPLEEDMATHSIILAWRIPMQKGFLGTSDGKESACNVGDPESIHG